MHIGASFGRARRWLWLGVALALLGCPPASAPRHPPGAGSNASAAASALPPPSPAAAPPTVMAPPNLAPPAPACRQPSDEPLPAGAVARMGSPRVGHGAFVRVAFLPHGEQLVSGDFYGDVHLWDADAARVIAWLGGPERDGHDFDGMEGLAVSRDGRFAIVASHRGLLFYDLKARKLHDEVGIDGERVNQLAVASEADVGVYGRCTERGDSLGTFDTKTGSLLRTYPGHEPDQGERCSHQVAISPDGALLATDADREVVIIRRQSGERVGHFRAGGVAVQSLAFSRDGTRLVVGTTDEALNVYDVASQRAVRSFGWVPPSTSASWLQGASLSPDDRLLAAEAHGVVRVWDYQTQALVARYGRVEGHDAAPVWSRDGKRLAYPSRDPDTVVVMDLVAGKRLGVADLCRHDGEVTGMTLSDDGALLATAGRDDTVRLWEATTGIARGRIERASAAAFSRDGASLAVVGWGCELRLHRTADGGHVSGQELAEGAWTQGMCTPVGMTRSPLADVVALIDRAGTLRLFDLHSGAELASRDLGDRLGEGETPSAPAWSPDGERIAVGHRGGITLLDSHAEQVASLPTKAGEPVYAVAWSPDGKLLLAQGYDEAQLLEHDGRPRGSFELSRWHALTFLSNDRLLVGRDVGVITTLDGVTETTVDARDSVRVVAASSDGELLATAGRHGVTMVWRRP